MSDNNDHREKSNADQTIERKTIPVGVADATIELSTGDVQNLIISERTALVGEGSHDPDQTIGDDTFEGDESTRVMTLSYLSQQDQADRETIPSPAVKYPTIPLQAVEKLSNFEELTGAFSPPKELLEQCERNTRPPADQSFGETVTTDINRRTLEPAEPRRPAQKTVWREFVVEVGKDGRLIVPEGLMRADLFQPGTRLLIRARILEN